MEDRNNPGLEPPALIAGSEGHEKRERSIREEDRGEVLGVLEVSKTELLRKKKNIVRVSAFCF